MNNKKLWKMSEIAIVIDLYNAGQLNLAAEKFGVSEQSIRRVVQRYDRNYKPTRRSPKFTELDYFITTYLVAKGLTFGEAAKIIGGSGAIRRNYFRYSERENLPTLGEDQINKQSIERDLFRSFMDQKSGD